MSIENTPFAQRSQEKIRFDHKDMDYDLSWILGREICDGRNRKECLSTGRRMVFPRLALDCNLGDNRLERSQNFDGE